MSNSPAIIRDMGGRRSGIDLRRFSYTGHIPERRVGDDRREGSDRRNGTEQRAGEDRRNTLDNEKQKSGAEIIDLRTHSERRSGLERRVAFA